MESQWNNMVVIGVFAVLLYCIGFGGVFLHTIWKAAQNFHMRHFQQRWKFLFIKFRANVWWWSIVFIAKGLCLNVGGVFLETGLAQVFWILICCNVYFALVIVYYPWRHRAVNAVDIYAHLAIMFVCSILVWFSRDGVENVKEKSQELSIYAMLVACSVLPFAVGVWCTIFRNWQKQDQRYEEAQQIYTASVKLASKNQTEAIEFIKGLGEWDRHYFLRAQELIFVELIGFVKENTRPRITPREVTADESLTKQEGDVVVLKREEYEKWKASGY